MASIFPRAVKLRTPVHASPLAPRLTWSSQENSSGSVFNSQYATGASVAVPPSFGHADIGRDLSEKRPVGGGRDETIAARGGVHCICRHRAGAAISDAAGDVDRAVAGGRLDQR